MILFRMRIYGKKIKKWFCINKILLIKKIYAKLILVYYFFINMLELDNLDSFKETPEDLIKKDQKIIDWLMNFWNNEANDNDFLEKTKWWDIFKSVINNLNKKSNQLNDNESKAKIEELVKNIELYSNIWKLNKEQMNEMSDIFKEIESIEWTEHAEDAESWELARKSINNRIKSEYQKLIDACKRLESLIKNHNEEIQSKLKSNLEKMKLARNKQKEQQSSYENLEFPLSQKI